MVKRAPGMVCHCKFIKHLLSRDGHSIWISKREHIGEAISTLWTHIKPFNNTLNVHGTCKHMWQFHRASCTPLRFWCYAAVILCSLLRCAFTKKHTWTCATSINKFMRQHAHNSGNVPDPCSTASMDEISCTGKPISPTTKTICDQNMLKETFGYESLDSESCSLHPPIGVLAGLLYIYIY